MLRGVGLGIGLAAGAAGLDPGLNPLGREGDFWGGAGRETEAFGRLGVVAGRFAEAFGRLVGTFGRAAGTDGRCARSFGRAAGTFGRWVGGFGRVSGVCGRVFGTFGRFPTLPGDEGLLAGRAVGAAGRVVTPGRVTGAGGLGVEAIGRVDASSPGTREGFPRSGLPEPLKSLNAGRCPSRVQSEGRMRSGFGRQGWPP